MAKIITDFRRKYEDISITSRSALESQMVALAMPQPCRIAWQRFFSFAHVSDHMAKLDRRPKKNVQRNKYVAHEVVWYACFPRNFESFETFVFRFLCRSCRKFSEIRYSWLGSAYIHVFMIKKCNRFWHFVAVWLLIGSAFSSCTKFFHWNLPYDAAGLEQLLANGTRELVGKIDSSHGDCGSFCLCRL